MKAEHKAAIGAVAPCLAPCEQFLRLPQVLALTGLGRTSILDAVKAGTFPKPIKHGSASLWLLTECRAWMLDRVSESRSVR